MNSPLSHLYIETEDNVPRIAIGAFDFDGNILAPNTPYRVIEIATGKEVCIPAHELDNNAELISGPVAQYQWMKNMEDSLVHFRDFTRYSEPNHLMDDTMNAIKNGLFSPSFEAFKETFLVRARLFAIITARGHSADNLERTIREISETVLSDEEKNTQYESIKNLYQALYPHMPIPNRDQALQFYFQEIVSYYTVSNAHIKKYLSLKMDTPTPEKKVISMDHYMQDMRRRILDSIGIDNSTPLAIGFSDDSVSNMRHMFQSFVKKRKNGTLKNDTVHLYFTGKQWALSVADEDCIHVSQNEKMTIIQV